MNKLYLLNSAVIPQNENGLFQHETLDQQDFIKILQHAVAEKIDIESYIGYPETQKHIHEITGYVPAICRDVVLRLEIATPILICRLNYRIQHPAMKAKYVPGVDDWNYSLMIKIEDNSNIIKNLFKTLKEEAKQNESGHNNRSNSNGFN